MQLDSRWPRARRHANALIDAFRDPGHRAVLVLFVFVVGGFVLFAAAWRGVARTTYVPLQLPWVLSAGVAGLAIIGAALGALSIHVGRRESAAYRAATDELVRTAVELTDDIRRRPAG